jgi:hypothetical protein
MYRRLMEINTRNCSLGLEMSFTQIGRQEMPWKVGIVDRVICEDGYYVEGGLCPFSVPVCWRPLFFSNVSVTASSVYPLMDGWIG